MEVNRKFFPSVMQDNETIYFTSLLGVIESVDELSSVEFVKGVGKYSIRVAPSLPKYSQMLLEELLKFHNLLKLRVELSKSIRNTSTIEYSIQDFCNE